MGTDREDRGQTVDNIDGYDARLARLQEEIDVLEEEITGASTRLDLLRRQTEVLERAARVTSSRVTPTSASHGGGHATR